MTASPLNNTTDNEDRDSTSDRFDLVGAARGGLCGGCTYARLVRSSKESVFVRCTRPELPKYQGQPVLRCPFFNPV